MNWGSSVPLRAALLFLAAVASPGFAADTAPQTEAAPPFEIERSHVHTLASRTLGRSYDLYVKLPPGYERPENAQRKYPVVYLTDGPYTFQVASGVSRVPFNQGTFEEFILVGLSYAQGEDPVQSRERDLTPFPDIRDKPYPTGGAPAYLDFLKDEAMPLVETAYRIDPAQRTLAGQSFGGLFGLWVLFTEPGLFRNYVLTSASLWYNRRAMFPLEAKFAEQHRDLSANVYFAIGANEHPAPCGRTASECSDDDMVADQVAMVKALRSRRYRSLKLHAKIVDGAYHTTTFPVGLLWAMQDLFLTHKLMSDGAAISPAEAKAGRGRIDTLARRARTPRANETMPSARASERNSGIDALRGASILFVIMNHIGIRIPLAKTALAAWLPAWLLRGLNWNGYEAVFIFFVISGFLITRRSLERWRTLGNISLRGFYWFRATRILPCLLLTIFCYSLFHELDVPSFVINKPDQSLAGAITSALGLYLNWYEAQYGYLAGGWDVLWSLSIEEVFYLAFPLACLTLGRTRLFVPVLILFALTLPFEHAWLHAHANEIWQEKAYLPGMAAIAIGVLAALIANRVTPRARWVGVACCIAGLAGLGAVFFAGKFVFHWLQDGYMLLLTGAAASLTLGCHWLDRSAPHWRLRGLGWLRSCGRLSYEIYLFHMFIVFPIVALAKGGILGAEWGWLWYPPTIALSWLLGLAVARGFSLPCERWLRRRFAPTGTRPQSVQTVASGA